MKMKQLIRRIVLNKYRVCLAMLFYNSVGIIYGQGYALDGGGGGNTAPLETVTSDIAQYIEPVRMLIYAIAAIVAIGGGISVYVKMNNEEQDVKNILVLQNWLERIRKEVTNKVLSIKRISDFLIFPILAQPTLKKI